MNLFQWTRIVLYWNPWGLDDSESLLVLNLINCELITVGSDNLMEEWLNRSRWLQVEI
jgi:hypothetical protein